jgi:hypothetical protein
MRSRRKCEAFSLEGNFISQEKPMMNSLGVMIVMGGRLTDEIACELNDCLSVNELASGVNDCLSVDEFASGVNDCLSVDEFASIASDCQ